MMHKKQKAAFTLSQKYNRNFSDEFKKGKVKEIVSGKISIKQLCNIYDISRTTAYRWLSKFGNIEKGVKTVVQMESEQTKNLALLQKVAELERELGRKEMKLIYVERILDIASEEIGYDIKKKYEPLLLNTSVV
jgi:transposase-like protein